MLDIPKTLSNMENRVNALEGKSIGAKDWLQEIIVQLVTLTNVVKQQNEEIKALKKER